MERKKVARLAGFTGAVCATAALAAVTVASTGAYFTDSKSGVINASTGSVKVNTTDTNLNYDGPLPGSYKTVKFGYSNAGTAAEDIWLVFPSDGSANQLTGENGNTALGRYGHFKLDAPDGQFVSNNLRAGSGGCPIDQYGRGGSAEEASSTAEYIPYCGVPHAILLSYNQQPGQYNEASIEFGYTKLLKDNAAQNQPRAQVAQFKIVATQHGVFPNDVNNDIP